MPRRCIIVGDIHGCWDELQELLVKVGFDRTLDRFISLGDIVDRGPRVRECVDFIMSLGFGSCILGNHEERQLKYYKKWLEKGSPTNPGVIESALKFRNLSHRNSFLSLEPKHFEWMKTLPRFIRLPYTTPDSGEPVTLVHAGCLPQIPIEDQDDYIRMHVSHVLPRADWVEDWLQPVQSWWANKAPPESRYWASIYDGASGYIVFGHAGVPSVQQFPHALAIDTGCCFGRSLTALVLPEWQLVSVPARDAYSVTPNTREFHVGPEDQVIFSG